MLSAMNDILTLSDPVRISFIEALLTDAGIEYALRDVYMADLLGMQNPLFPKRLAVASADAKQAERILSGAGQFYDD